MKIVWSTRGTEWFRCLRGWFLSTMPRNKSCKHTHARACARNTRWAVCRSFESWTRDGIHFRRRRSVRTLAALFLSTMSYLVLETRTRDPTWCSREASGVLNSAVSTASLFRASGNWGDSGGAVQHGCRVDRRETRKKTMQRVSDSDSSRIS